MKRWFTIASVILLTVAAQAAPITLKELEFLLRQKTPEAEIIAQAQQRRLLTSLSPEASATLKQNGASDALLKALNAPGMTLSAEEIASERQRQAANEAQTARAMAEDATAHSALEKQRRILANQNNAAGKTTEFLDGKLVRLNGDQFNPVSSRDLSNVRVFGLYYSAMWCAPCRKFTPILVTEYQRLKRTYGDQFEIIFVSSDQDEFNMRQYMKTDQMQWPALRFGTKSDFLQRYAPTGIPWLVAVNSAGEPMTMNGVDKKYIDPRKVLEAIEQLLASGRR